MKKTPLSLFIIIFTVFIVFFLTLNMLGYFYGQYFGDFYSQHLNFINYLRTNFYYTKDIFPQFNMNMGFGQSMVTMYYHGLFNPYIMLSYIVPFIPTEIYFEIIVSFVFAATFASSFYLLSYYKYCTKIRLITSSIVTFSGVLIYHSHYHPMFIYYLPFAFINLILIHKLVTNNKGFLLSLSIALVFFMNFFFAPMVMIINTAYFIILVHQKNNKLSLSIKYIIANIIAITIGFLVTLPQFIAFIDSTRVGGTEETPSLIGVNLALPIMYIINPYILGVGIIGFCALIYFLIKRDNKILFYIALTTFILSFIDIINYLINVGQYVNYKQLIYALPFISILIAGFLNEKSNLKNKMVKYTFIIAIIITVIVGIILQIDIVTKFLKYFETITVIRYPFIMTILVVILLCTHYYIVKIDIIMSSKKIIIALCLILSVTAFTLYASFYQGMWFENITQVTCSNEEMEYTNNAENTNQNQCINESTPGYFTSIINADYINFFKSSANMSSYGFERKVNNASFDNYFANIVFNLEGDGYNFIYGQTTENLYNGTDTSVYEMYFYDVVDGGPNTTPVKEPDMVIDEFSIDGYMEVPIALDEGVMVIEMDVSDFCPELSYKTCFIDINGQRNQKQITATSNGSTFYFYIDLSEINNQLIINATPGVRPINGVNIYYFSPVELSHQKEVIDIYNLEIDYNNSYSFEIDMPSEGYIITTLMYDKNFDIYVDGIKVTPEKVNEAFLGFQVTAGHHEITISYTIRGFYLSFILFIIGILMAIVLFIYEKKYYPL